MCMHAAAAHVCMCMWWKDMLACGILEKEKSCVERKQIKVACMLIPRTVPACKEIKQEAVHAKE
jgi:hypothetical protein